MAMSGATLLVERSGKKTLRLHCEASRMSVTVESHLSAAPLAPTELASPSPNPIWPRLYVCLAALGYVMLVIFVLSRTNGLVYDESELLVQAHALAKNTTFFDWIRNNDTNAQGPVYPLLHYALSGGAGAAPPPWLRIPNMVLVVVVIALIVPQLRLLGCRYPLAAAASIMSIPMTWVVTGIALTEIPAMVGITLAAYAAAQLGYGDAAMTKNREYVLAVLAALGIALAMCGRQTHLLTLPGLVLLAARNRRRTKLMLLATAIGLLPAFGLFYLWGGLVPPRVPFYQQRQAIRPLEGILGIGYAGAVSLLLAPRLMLRRWRWAALAAGLLALANAFIGYRFVPLQSAHHLLDSRAISAVLEAGGGSLIMALAGAFAAALAAELIERRTERFLFAYAWGLATLCAVCARTGFSSRYVAMILPFVVPTLAGYMDFGPWSVARLLFGMTLGGGALYSYYAH
jgi:hypothetical protein